MWPIICPGASSSNPIAFRIHGSPIFFLYIVFGSFGIGEDAGTPGPNPERRLALFIHLVLNPPSRLIGYLLLRPNPYSVPQKDLSVSRFLWDIRTWLPSA